MQPTLTCWTSPAYLLRIFAHGLSGDLHLQRASLIPSFTVVHTDAETSETLSTMLDIKRIASFGMQGISCIFCSCDPYASLFILTHPYTSLFILCIASSTSHHLDTWCGRLSTLGSLAEHSKTRREISSMVHKTSMHVYHSTMAIVHRPYYNLHI